MRGPCLAVVLLGLGAGCGGSGGAGGGIAPFVILRTEPSQNATVFLNDSVRFFFTAPVDLTTVNFNTVAFRVMDAQGRKLSELVTGRFRYAKDAEGSDDPRVLEFVPNLPTNDTYSNGGLRPGRRYLVSIVRSNERSAPQLRDVSGRPLSEASEIDSLAFESRSGSSAGELFRDARPGGPRVVSVEAAPLIDGRLALNRLAEPPVEIELRFDQALNPHSANLPVGQDLDPRRDALRKKGRIWLEYDDPELGRAQWIRADVEVVANDLAGATVVLRPDGVLPNDADVRVIVDVKLEDIAGQSNAKTADYDRVVGRLRTEEALVTAFDAVVLDFEGSALADTDAAFGDPVAEVEDGVLRASFDFEGRATQWDFDPDTRVTVLNTDFTQVPIANGPPLMVGGGIFNFRDVRVGPGKTVRGVGTNPLVILATGRVLIDGHLHVNGGDGGQVDSLNAANTPTAGGAGVCTGGAGGLGSPSSTATSPRGETGYGAFGKRGGGGEGGRLCCSATQRGLLGSGGGGGSFATVGDPDWYGRKGVQINGTGGTGRNRAGPLTGGAPGAKAFADTSAENDFWGRRIKDGAVISGELRAPRGGSGGGGGGDRTAGTQSNPCVGANFINDEKGGGGGGGAGVLIVKALGPIIIGKNALVSADGGRGGGGEQAGSCNEGGGGGGGAGGMVVLMSATRIDIWQQGRRWSDGDANFSITADGSIGRNTGFGGAPRLAKYPNTNGVQNAGGFGGMGIVQLMTPPGRDADRSGTVQDDAIRVLDSTGHAVGAAAKTATLFGGDLRPDPWLLPVPYGRYSRFDSRWIATGATVRRQVGAAGRGPRAVRQPGRPGPAYRFAGIEPSGTRAGWLRTDPKTGRLADRRLSFGGRSRFAIESASDDGADIEVKLVDAKLPDDGSLANHRARALGASGEALAEFRIARHGASSLRLDRRGGPWPTPARSLEILEKFYAVAVEGVAGLGETFVDSKTGWRFPKRSLRLGFAFHRNPADPQITSGEDRNRWPRKLGTFVYDLESEAARSRIRDLHYPFVKISIRFNLNFNPADPSTPGPHPVEAETPRPELDFLLLPLGF